MKSKITFRVEGLREMEEALKEFPRSTTRGILRKALADGLQPIVDQAESQAPVASGHLRDSHMVGTKLSARQQSAHRRWAGTTPVRTPRGWRSAPSKSVFVFGGPGPLAQATLQEWGTADHPPQPYMRPAWDGKKQEGVGIFMKRMADHLEAAKQRLARKAARLAKKLQKGTGR